MKEVTFKTSILKAMIGAGIAIVALSIGVTLNQHCAYADDGDYPPSDRQVLYQLYNPLTNEHLYTTNTDVCCIKMFIC